MKKLTLLSIYLFISASVFSQSSTPKLLWSDEFDQNGLPDSKKWSYDVGDHGWGNNELQYYTKENLQNARVENGRLIIEAKADNTLPKGYTSARLVSKNKGFWKYGYFEIKAKLPEGLGTWPAIWMLPEENTFGGWPKSGEIDIMEHVGFDPSVVHGTVHTEAFNHNIGTQKGNQVKVADFNTAFHVYAIDWKEDRIDFYIDGKKYFTFENEGKTYREWPFDQPFHLIFNIAVGGNWGGKEGVATDIWPQKMEIDYVRVFSAKPE